MMDDPQAQLRPLKLTIRPIFNTLESHLAILFFRGDRHELHFPFHLCESTKQFTDPCAAPRRAAPTYVSCTNGDVFSLVPSFPPLPPSLPPAAVVRRLLGPAESSVCSVLETVQVRFAPRPPSPSLAPRRNPDQSRELFALIGRTRRRPDRHSPLPLSLPRELIRPSVRRMQMYVYVQGWAKEWALDCVNPSC